MKDNHLQLENKLINVLIPARSGSKRLPRKNLNIICGKPLIAWSIQATKQSSYVKKIFVSTDSKEIAEILSLLAPDICTGKKCFTYISGLKCSYSN